MEAEFIPRGEAERLRVDVLVEEVARLLVEVATLEAQLYEMELELDASRG